VSFFPGNRVRIVLGDDIGLPGEVVSGENAIVLWQSDGRAADSFKHHVGQICATVLILDAPVPMALDLNN
jgi:hypothetical protein